MSLQSVANSAKRALAANQARRGDLVAIRYRRSSVSLKDGYQQQWVWYIGRVERASREGVVREAVTLIKTGLGEMWEQKCREAEKGRWWEALVIGADKQAAALAAAGQEYATADDLRVAILAKLAA